jgi:ribonuclease P protein subunit RPR2
MTDQRAVVDAGGAAVDTAVAQTLRYAEELRDVVARERRQRRRAQDALERLEASYATTVRALAAAVDLRDDATGRHAHRVTELALALAREVAPECAADPNLEFGFLLHDVGKIGVPDAILLKPGPLTSDEQAAMRRHPELGGSIVETVPYLTAVACETIRHHHERWDGRGYPDGLAGDRIPLPARMFALTDAWDAMTNDRPYRRALPREEAVARIVAGAGSQFDAALVEPFLALA